MECSCCRNIIRALVEKDGDYYNTGVLAFCIIADDLFVINVQFKWAIARVVALGSAMAQKAIGHRLQRVQPLPQLPCAAAARRVAWDAPLLDRWHRALSSAMMPEISRG